VWPLHVAWLPHSTATCGELGVGVGNYRGPRASVPEHKAGATQPWEALEYQVPVPISYWSNQSRAHREERNRPHHKESPACVLPRRRQHVLSAQLSSQCCYQQSTKGTIVSFVSPADLGMSCAHYLSLCREDSEASASLALRPRS
jgi:hypothetical protein